MQKKKWVSLATFGALLLALGGLSAHRAEATVANGVLYLNRPATMYHGYDDTRQSTGQTLKAGSQWKITGQQESAGVTWYQVATNTWVTENAQFNPQQSYGVVRLNQTATIYTVPGDKNTSTGRNLNAGSSWRVTDQQVVAGVTWYQVATNTWVTQNYAFNPIPYQTVTLAQPTTLYNGYGAARQFTGRTLAIGSAWKITHAATENGVTWYEIGPNQWITTNTSYNPVPDHFDNAIMTITVNTKNGANVYSSYQAGRWWVNRLSFGSRWKVTRQAVANDGSLWYQVGTNQWVSATGGIATGVVYPNSAYINGVPLISQLPELPNGCEITAVTMMLRYAGANVNKMQLAREMPRSSNPNYGYIGDPWNNTGITIFPPALMNIVQKYAGNSINMTGMSFDAIRYQVGIRKHPVVAWMTMHGFPYHAVVVTGYSASTVTYLDCWTNSVGTMSIDAFVNNWQTQNRRAISY